jgi:hypothetical protein
MDDVLCIFATGRLFPANTSRRQGNIDYLTIFSGFGKISVWTMRLCKEWLPFTAAAVAVIDDGFLEYLPELYKSHGQKLPCQYG